MRESETDKVYNNSEDYYAGQCDIIKQFLSYGFDSYLIREVSGLAYEDIYNLEKEMKKEYM